MAKIYLETTDTNYVVSNNNTTVNGSTGTENVVIASGVTGTVVTSTVEVVDFAGAAADFRFEQGFGSNMTVKDASGNIVATISDLAGKKLTFTDGSALLAYDATTGVTLGGTAVTTTSAAVVPATIDATETSTATTGTTGGSTATPLNAALTATSDILSGTSSDDTVTGTAGTLAASDVIVDSTTTDNDTLTVTETLTTAVTTAAATISGIENVNFNINSFVASKVDASTISNVKTLTANMTQAGGSTDVTVEDVAGTADVTAGSNVTQLSVEYGATNGSAGKAVNGSAATTTIEVGTIDLDGVTITSNATSTTAINIEGTTAASDKATIIADVASGSTIALNTNAYTDFGATTVTDQVENVTLKGKSAAVTYALGASDAIDTVDFAGDYSVTLNAAAADVSTETLTSSLTAGTATLKVTTSATSDMTKVANAVIIDLSVDGNGHTYSVANAANVKLSGSQTAPVFSSVAATKATNTLTIEMAHNTIGAIDVNNVEDLTLNATAKTATGAADTITLTSAAFEATQDVIITGASNVTFDTDVTADSIDGSAMTGILSLGDSTGPDYITLTDTVTSGSGNDVLYMNATGVNKITSNAGNDSLFIGANVTTLTVDMGAGNDSIELGTAGANTVATINGGDGTDTVKLDAAATVTYTANNLMLSNVEVLEIDAATTVAASTLSGKTFIVTGSTNVLTATMDTTSADFSNISFDSAAADKGINVTTTAINSSVTGSAARDLIVGNSAIDTLNGGYGADDIDGKAGNDVIDGQGGDDTLKGDAGNDTITGGEGIDGITGGAGNDTIILTETTAKADNVIFTGYATNGVDTIKGFAAGDGVDTLTFASADTSMTTTSANAVMTSTSATLVTGGATWNISADVDDTAHDVVEVLTILDDDVTLSATSTGTDLMQALSSDSTVAAGITMDATADAFNFVVYQNGNAYVWNVTEAGGDAEAVASETTLIGVVEGVAHGAFATGDILMGA